MRNFTLSIFLVLFGLSVQAQDIEQLTIFGKDEYVRFRSTTAQLKGRVSRNSHPDQSFGISLVSQLTGGDDQGIIKVCR